MFYTLLTLFLLVMFFMVRSNAGRVKNLEQNVLSLRSQLNDIKHSLLQDAPKQDPVEKPETATPWEKSPPKEHMSAKNKEAQLASEPKEMDKQTTHKEHQEEKPKAVWPKNEKSVAFQTLHRTTKRLDSAQNKTRAGLGFGSAVARNFKKNWIIWIAGVSLALGGLFIVQIGIERGMFGPGQRIIAAIVFGLLLIFVAEKMRRKSPDGITELYAPEVALASGGVATLFGAFVAVHYIYGSSIGILGFVPIALVGFLSLVLGVSYGPVLAVIGLLGAFGTPLIVVPIAASPVVYGYFLIVYVACLVLERHQKWIWFSTLAAIFALLWGALLAAKFNQLPYTVLYLAAIMALTVTLPSFGFPPRWRGARMVSTISALRISIHYPTLFAVFTALGATVLMFFVSGVSLVMWQSALMMLSVLLYLSIFHLSRTQNLDQMTPIFGVGLLGLIAVGPEPSHFGIPRISSILSAHGGYSDQFEFVGLFTIGVLSLLALASIWRPSRSVRPLYWIILGAGAPLVFLPVIWLFWQNQSPLLIDHWAEIGIIAAAIQGALAIRFSRTPANAGAWVKTAVAFFTLSSLALLMLVAWLFLTDVPLTLAIGSLGLLAMILVAQYRLVLVHWFAIFSVLLSGFRLVAHPGLSWAIDAQFSQFAAAFSGSVVLFTLAYWFAVRAKQKIAILFFETAAFSTTAIGLCILGGRLLDATTERSLVSVALYCLVWLILAFTQLYRAGKTQEFVKVRTSLGAIYLILSAGMMALALTDQNPLLNGGVTRPLFINEMTFAYLLPAGLLFLISTYLKHINIIYRRYANIGANILLGIYLMLEIRHFWHGSNMQLIDATHERSLMSIALYSPVLFILAFAQFYLAGKTKDFIKPRMILGNIFLSLSTMTMVLALTDRSPLLMGTVTAPLFFNEMTFAYLFPASLLFLISKYLKHIDSIYRKYAYIGANILLGIYLMLEIRHFWHGSYMQIFDASIERSLTSIALYSPVLFVLAFAQFYYAGKTKKFASSRLVLGNIFLALSTAIMVLALTEQSPLLRGSVNNPLFFNEMTFAYLLPAALLFLIAKYLKHIDDIHRKYAKISAGILFGIYLILEIRHFWHGSNMQLGQIIQPELYSYTIVMLLASVTLIVYSIYHRDRSIHSIALGVTAATALKVFLWDMAGLEGLTRAAAFICLGLSLAGIGWLHQRFRGWEAEAQNPVPNLSNGN